MKALAKRQAKAGVSTGFPTWSLQVTHAGRGCSCKKLLLPPVLISAQSQVGSDISLGSAREILAEHPAQDPSLQPVLPQALWGCFSSREWADPSYFLISTWAVISHVEAQCHFPRSSRGVIRHHLSPEVYAPSPVYCTWLRDQPRQSSTNSKHLFLLPWLSFTVPWSFLFGCAGEWREAE